MPTLVEIQNSKFIKFCHETLKNTVPGAAFDGEPFLIPSSGFLAPNKPFIAANCFYHTIYVVDQTVFVFNRDEGGMVPWVEVNGFQFPDTDYLFDLINIDIELENQINESFNAEICIFEEADA